MSASLTFELDQFHKGYFLAWEVLSQTASTGIITLKAGNKTYFTASKNNSTTGLLLLAQDSADYNQNETLTLTVTVNGATQLKQSLTSGAINDEKARKVGYTYSFCIEDWTDNDYNDYYINIVGWARKG